MLKIKICCYLFVLCFFSTSLLSAQPRITQIKLLSAKNVRYQKMEWSIGLTADYSNPYDQEQVALDLQLVSPSGKPVSLPCYYDNVKPDEAGWKARFSPQEEGVYTGHFTLRDHSGSTESGKLIFKVQASLRPGFLHKNDYWTFKFDNGSLFRGLGENVGWESRSFESEKYNYDNLLPVLAKNGANFFRTWMCPWNLPLEWKKVNATKRYKNTDEYFNPGGIRQMEHLIHLTDSLSLYFMLTLDMNSPNWKNSPYNKINGGPVDTWNEFFTSTAAIEKYKNKLRYLVARWGYSTHIAAWEFFNEIDNGAFNKADSVVIPHADITEWHIEMSRYLKDIDPYGHLVTTSISHRDIIGLNAIPYIDFNQKHIYKHTEKIPAIYPDYIQTFNKPYVVGEFGFRWEDADPKYSVDAIYDYKRGLWYGLFSSTPILPMSWWWEFFNDQHAESYLGGVRQISDMMLKAGKGKFSIVNAEAGVFHSQSVACGNTVFVYLLNESNARQSATVSVPVSQAVNLSIYDPELRKFSDNKNFAIRNNKLMLNNITLDGRACRILVLTKKVKPD